MSLELPITAIVAAHRRFCVLETIRHIKTCSPAPREIIVHVDGGHTPLVSALQAEHPEIIVLTSSALLGPGGSRDVLLRAASHEIVASFDDDSFPSHTDYFVRAVQSLGLFPSAGILSAASMPSEWVSPSYTRLAVYSGCGSVFRRSCYLQTRGFVPLEIAYGMEETDISLQMNALQHIIVHDPALRVRHEHAEDEKACDLNRSATIFINNALLAALRYPAVLWPLACAQITLHIMRQIMQGRIRLLAAALRMMPRYIRQYLHHRQPVGVRAVLYWLLLKRQKLVLNTQPQNTPCERHYPACQTRAAFSSAELGVT